MPAIQWDGDWLSNVGRKMKIMDVNRATKNEDCGCQPYGEK